MRKEILNQPSDGLLVYPDIVNGEPIVLKEHEQVWTPSQFGLGLARLIAEQDWTHAQVLDLASGSGILGLVALRKGAKHVTGVDLNPYASDAMAANWKANRLILVERFYGFCCVFGINRQYAELYVKKRSGIPNWSTVQHHHAFSLHIIFHLLFPLSRIMLLTVLLTVLLPHFPSSAFPQLFCLRLATSLAQI